MKTPATAQKLRGGYYTPPYIAEFLAEWAIRSSRDRVLEPSCGDGAILDPVVNVLTRRGALLTDISSLVRGIETDAAEALSAQDRLLRLGVPDPSKSVIISDFFRFCEMVEGSERFDVAIGNPPFIRFQHFPDEHRKIAFKLAGELGLRLNGLTNAWVPFVAVATKLLNEGGRLAMVIPAELLQVDYAAQLREFLSESFRTVMVFTFKQLLFEGIQQEVVLVCADGFSRGRVDSEIDMIALDGPESLMNYAHVPVDGESRRVMDHSTEKWTQYYLEKHELDLIRTLREHPRLSRLGQLASIDVGVVTGMNDFFVLNEQDRQQLSLNGYTKRLASRSAQLQGIEFTEADWLAHVDSGAGMHLLDLPSVPHDQLPEQVKKLVLSGEAGQVHTGYKCRIRKLWYIVPSTWIPDAFLLRQIHKYPKMVLNAAGATCTDTIHRVRLLPGVDGRRLTSATVNSLTFAFSEIVGRSYGGGVLELEPREAEKLPIPYPDAPLVDFDEVHRLIADGNIVGALEIVDKALLFNWLGLSPTDIRRLREIWTKLQSRRIGRKRRERASTPLH